MFAAQGVAFKDSKSPVWYPYFGSWFIGTTLEVVLLSITIFRPTSGLTLQYLFRAGHALRCAMFLTLLVLYFSWQHSSRKHDDDVEQQSLLGKDSLCTADDSQTQAYGGTKTANTATKKENTAGDSWVNEQRTREEAMAKRLEQDGWLAYVRSFSVRLVYEHIRTATDILDTRPIHLAPSRQKASVPCPPCRCMSLDQQRLERAGT